MPLSRILLNLACAAACALLVACGGQSGGGTRDDATLLLDSAPSAVHAGIVMTLERDYDGAERVELRVRTPKAATDPVRALEERRADAAILTLRELVRARKRGHDVVGVMAVVQRPLKVLAVSRTTLQDEPRLIERLIVAVRRGYEEALRDPESAVGYLTSRNRKLDREDTLRALRRVSPTFTAGVSRYGELDRERLENEVPDAEEAFEFEVSRTPDPS